MEKVGFNSTVCVHPQPPWQRDNYSIKKLWKFKTVIGLFQLADGATCKNQSVLPFLVYKQHKKGDNSHNCGKRVSNLTQIITLKAVDWSPNGINWMSAKIQWLALIYDIGANWYNKMLILILYFLKKPNIEKQSLTSRPLQCLWQIWAQFSRDPEAIGFNKPSLHSNWTSHVY